MNKESVRESQAGVGPARWLSEVTRLASKSEAPTFISRAKMAERANQLPQVVL